MGRGQVEGPHLPAPDAPRDAPTQAWAGPAERGITFERLASGEGSFPVGVMVDGSRNHRVVGKEIDGTTRTLAEEYIEKLRWDAKHDRLALPAGRKVASSFAAAAIKYIEKSKAADGRNLGTKKRHLELHLVPFFASMPLSKLTRSTSNDMPRGAQPTSRRPVVIGVAMSQKCALWGD